MLQIGIKSEQRSQSKYIQFGLCVWEASAIWKSVGMVSKSN